jgi:LytS/YehU family sensor histidine kinase
VFRFSLLTNALKGMFLWSWLVYLLIVGGCLVWHYHGRLLRGQLEIERLERQFSEARLQALRMQLDPHFLFNALNTISSQVERDPRLARAMIGHLGDLLRLSLESKDKRVVTLAEELAFLDHYLAIQKIRFGENLSVTIEVDPAVNDALLPALLLQPLVENAIRHGFSRRSRGGCVTVTARGGGDQLQLRVVDDGVGLPARWSLEDSTGLGLSITRERIAGSAGRFSIQNRAEGGAEVTLSLPLRFARREMSAT